MRDGGFILSLQSVTRYERSASHSVGRDEPRGPPGSAPAAFSNRAESTNNNNDFLVLGDLLLDHTNSYIRFLVRPGIGLTLKMRLTGGLQQVTGLPTTKNWL